MGHKGTKIKTKICKKLAKINGYFFYPHTEFGSERSFILFLCVLCSLGVRKVINRTQRHEGTKIFVSKRRNT